MSVRVSGRSGGRDELQLERDDSVRGEVAVGDREGQESGGEAPVPVGVDGRGLGGRAELLPCSSSCCLSCLSFFFFFFAAASAAPEKAGESRPHAEGGGRAAPEMIPVPSSSCSSQTPRERGAPPGREAVDAEADL